MKLGSIGCFLLACSASLGFADARIVPNFDYCRTQRDASAVTYEKLSKLVDVNFVNTKLGDALSQIASEHDVAFEVSENDLHDIGISIDDTFTFVAKQLPLRQVLDVILEDKILDLDFEVEGSIVTVTSVDAIRIQTRIYEVAHLVFKRPGGVSARNRCEFEPEPYEEDGGYGQGCWNIADTAAEETPPVKAPSNETCSTDERCESTIPSTEADDTPRHTDRFDFDSLVETLKTTVTPGVWGTSDDNSVIRPLIVGERPVLVVMHTERGHHELAKLLSQLEDLSSIGRDEPVR